MAKSERIPDVDVITAAVREQATDEDHIVKNHADVALGRLGGLNGGRARAERLTSTRRSEIAKKAAFARWRE
jgi:hypothetical protein